MVVNAEPMTKTHGWQKVKNLTLSTHFSSHIPEGKTLTLAEIWLLPPTRAAVACPPCQACTYSATHQWTAQHTYILRARYIAISICIRRPSNDFQSHRNDNSTTVFICKTFGTPASLVTCPDETHATFTRQERFYCPALLLGTPTHCFIQATWAPLHIHLFELCSRPSHPPCGVCFRGTICILQTFGE